MLLLFLSLLLFRVSTTPGNPGNLMEFKNLLEISWNLIGPPGNFCVRCQRLTALVSSQKTGYQIAYLRN